MSKQRILALDLGTTTGYAISGGVSPISGTMTFKPNRWEGGGMRYLRFRNEVAEMIRCGRIQAVYYEEVRAHRGTDAAHVYGGLLGQLTALCEELEIPYGPKTVQEIKINATGKGNANKEAMIVAAKNRGWNPADDNEADALWLLDLVTQCSA